MSKDRFRVVDYTKPKPLPRSSDKTTSGPPQHTLKSAMFSAAIILIPVVLMARCAMSPPSNGTTSQAELMTFGEPVIKARLRDPSSATFTDEFVGSLKGKPVLCGTVNSRNGFGGMGGPERFITDDRVGRMESEFQPGEFEVAWAAACGGRQ